MPQKTYTMVMTGGRVEVARALEERMARRDWAVQWCASERAAALPLELYRCDGAILLAPLTHWASLGPREGARAAVAWVREALRRLTANESLRRVVLVGSAASAGRGVQGSPVTEADWYEPGGTQASRWGDLAWSVESEAYRWLGRGAPITMGLVTAIGAEGTRAVDAVSAEDAAKGVMAMLERGAVGRRYVLASQQLRGGDGEDRPRGGVWRRVVHRVRARNGGRDRDWEARALEGVVYRASRAEEELGVVAR